MGAGSQNSRPEGEPTRPQKGQIIDFGLWFSTVSFLRMKCRRMGGHLLTNLPPFQVRAGVGVADGGRPWVRLSCLDSSRAGWPGGMLPAGPPGHPHSCLVQLESLDGRLLSSLQWLGLRLSWSLTLRLHSSMECQLRN